MPKELIYDIGENDSFAVRVNWGRENETLQVATVKVEPDSDNDGWFVTLDRSRINNLIKVLRKARDQAFGADE